jgi:hypothetical protein
VSGGERPFSPFEDDASLASRAAWLHYAGGLTQGEVAARLNIPAIKAHRPIARAGRDGLIRIFVDGAVAECVQLEEILKARFQLEAVQVAPDLGEPGLPLKALAFAARAISTQSYSATRARSWEAATAFFRQCAAGVLVGWVGFISPLPFRRLDTD